MSLTTADYVALAGIGAVASAAISVLATIASFLAANGARRAAQLTARQLRDALVRETYRNAHQASAVAARVDQIAEVVYTAYSNMYIASGQGGGGSAMNKINAELEAINKRTKEITDYSLKFMMSEPKAHADEDLGHTQRKIDGQLVELEGMKEKLSQDLELARSGAASPHAAVLLAAALRNMHRSHGAD